MIPKSAQSPDAPRQRVYNPRHPAFAAVLVALIAVALLVVLMLG